MLMALNSWIYSWLWSVFSAQLAFGSWSAAQQKVSPVSYSQSMKYIVGFEQLRVLSLKLIEVSNK